MAIKIFRPLYPILRRNSTFWLFAVAGGLIFEQVFHQSTRYWFYEVHNKGNGFNYLEQKVLARKAEMADEDDE